MLLALIVGIVGILCAIANVFIAPFKRKQHGDIINLLDRSIDPEDARTGKPFC